MSCRRWSLCLRSDSYHWVPKLSELLPVGIGYESRLELVDRHALKIVADPVKYLLLYIVDDLSLHRLVLAYFLLNDPADYILGILIISKLLLHLNHQTHHQTIFHFWWTTSLGMGHGDSSRSEWILLKRSSLRSLYCLAWTCSKFKTTQRNIAVWTVALPFKSSIVKF